MAALLVIALAIRAVRDPRHEPLVVPVPHSHPYVVAVLLVAGAAVVGSWAGALGAVAGILAVRLGKRGCAALPVSVLPAVAIALIYADKGTAVFVGQAKAVSQTLCLLAVGALAALLTERPAPGPFEAPEVEAG